MKTMYLEEDGTMRDDQFKRLEHDIIVEFAGIGRNGEIRSISTIPIEDPKGDTSIILLGQGRRNSSESEIYQLLIPHSYLVRFSTGQVPSEIRICRFSLEQHLDREAYLNMNHEVGSRCRKGLIGGDTNGSMNQLKDGNFESIISCQNNFDEPIEFRLFNIDLHIFRMVQVRSILPFEDFVYKVRESFQDAVSFREEVIERATKEKATPKKKQAKK